MDEFEEACEEYKQQLGIDVRLAEEIESETDKSFSEDDSRKIFNPIIIEILRKNP